MFDDATKARLSFPTQGEVEAYGKERRKRRALRTIIYKEAVNGEVMTCVKDVCRVMQSQCTCATYIPLCRVI